ncbi:glutathione synthetase [Streptomyces sp. 110]|uniref:Glutathione synthetase n=1 Tax=Streptomyces endocoffeicus TaxID=2898945 RepID=A0ABS1PSI3_9ACTN|nr:glutathione synthetase [Streptomyces endocoffeicus]MBL1115244.1 glutathione synthetase [Streptomyces endocoffeicus]
MATATPAPSENAPPAHRPCTAAVIAPDGPGNLYASALARYGWSTVAVTTAAAECVSHDSIYLHTFAHTGGVQWTVKHLARLGVQAILAGSPEGTALADQLADHLALPGNDAATSEIRNNIALTAAALNGAGITAASSTQSTRLGEALSWYNSTRPAAVILQHPHPAHPHPGLLCRNTDEIRTAWNHLRSTVPSPQPLVLRERLPGTQYQIHTITIPSLDGIGDHAVTAIWSQTLTPARVVSRADLISRDGLLARALARYTLRALTALGIRFGPARAEITLVPDRGPTLLSVRTDPHADFATDALRRATGHDPVSDTARMLTTGRYRDLAHPRRIHVTKVALLPPCDGTLDPALLSTITTLRTVAATTELTAGTPVTAGQPAGWLLLVADDRHAINYDYQVIRSVETGGLYQGRTA